MREYGRIAPTFWTRGTGKALRGHPEAQIVALYLMSAPTSNMIGMYYMPLATIALETGLPLQGARKGLARLIEVGFCMYDFDADFVLVHTMARRQAGLEEGEVLKHDNPDPNKWDKRCHGAARLMRECNCSALLQSFWDRYNNVFGLPNPWWIATPSKPLPSPIEAPPKPSAGSGSSAGKEQEQTLVGLGTRPAPESDQPSLPSIAEPEEPKTKDEPTDVERVFEYWRERLMPKAKLDDKRHTIIARALKTYTVEELCKAVDGTLLDPHRMGQNDRGRKYVDCDLVFRNAEKIDPMIVLAEEGSNANDFEWGNVQPPHDDDPVGTKYTAPTPEQRKQLEPYIGPGVLDRYVPAPPAGSDR